MQNKHYEEMEQLGKVKRASHSEDALLRMRSMAVVMEASLEKLMQMGTRIYGTDPTPLPDKDKPIEEKVPLLDAMQHAQTIQEDLMELIRVEINRLENFA